MSTERAHPLRVRLGGHGARRGCRLYSNQRTSSARSRRSERCQKLPSANCYIPFSSCACLPIQFASLIHGLIERAASECFAKAIFASDVYERLGRQALASGER
jgi:hypothetical protein